MRDEKGRFAKGCKIDSCILKKRVVTRKLNGWHSEKSKENISNGQKANLLLIEKRRIIAKKMGLSNRGGRNITEIGRKKNRIQALFQFLGAKDGLFFNTKPEIEMKKCLIELGINEVKLNDWKLQKSKHNGQNIFIHQYPVENIEHCYCADFYLPLYNLVLEVDGRYRHNYPDGLKIDLERTQEMEDVGYRVLRFWEDEFNSQIIWKEI